MAKRIYVGNLPWSVGSDELRQLFQAHGEVVDAVVLTDRASGRSRGFGFVEMATDEATEKAIEAVNGAQVGGRSLVVNEARQREDRDRRR